MNPTYLFTWACLSPLLMYSVTANEGMTSLNGPTSLKRAPSFPPSKIEGPTNFRDRTVRDLFKEESSPSNRTKRQTIDCEQLAKIYENRGYVENHMWGPTNSITEAQLQHKTNLPLVVRARVKDYHLDHARTNFGKGPRVKDRMKLMDRRKTDKKGHIIASQLGGPSRGNTLYNLAPQTPKVERELGNAGDDGWFNLANLARDELNRDKDGHIEITVVLDYNFEKNRRPTGFSICFRSFDWLNRERQNIAKYYSNK